MSLLPIFAHLSFLLLPLLLLTSSFILPSHSHQIQDPRLIDRIIRDSAFLSHPNHHIKTAVLYHINLPPTLPGVTAHIARFRSGSLRRHGAEINNFRFAPGSVIVRPRTPRLLVICQNLGNRFSSVYDISGFRLVSPVLGLLVYDAASNHLDVFVRKQPIAVNFSGLVGETRGRLMCAAFLLDGKVRLSNLTDTDIHTCVAWGQGHFGLVVSSSDMEVGRLRVVMLMAVGGAFVAVLLGLVAIAMVKVKRNRCWIEEMERRAYEEEALQISMVGHVRAPTATLARTTPALQNDYYPCL